MTHHALCILALGAAGLASAAEVAPAPVLPPPLPFTGVNLAGGEFGDPKPGSRLVYGRNYVYPTDQQFAYFAAKGMNTFRVCCRWENLQPEPAQPLAADELARLRAVVEAATARGLVVILDPHNYARYHGRVVGSPELGVDVFADFWGRLAREFADRPNVWLGLVNEPHGLPTRQWLLAANAAIRAIRTAGNRNLILVPGNAYSGAHSWTATWYGEANGDVMLGVEDPLDYYAYEVHQYLDKDSSGTKPEVVSPTVGSERLQAFTDWCRKHRKRAFLGEFGVAAGDLGRAAVDNMLRTMERDRDVWLGFAWWAAGAWWGEYMFSIEPKDGQDRPQLAALLPHLHGGTLPEMTVTVAIGNAPAATHRRKPGDVLDVQAPGQEAAQPFRCWTGDTAWLADSASPKTALTVPFRDVTVRAAYGPAERPASGDRP